jgi:hypothetical protein
MVLDVHVRGVKINVFWSRYCYDTSFIKKKFMEKYLCWFALWEPYVPYKTLIEMMVESTSSFNNVYEVVDDNNNNCRSMVIDAMIMN